MRTAMRTTKELANAGQDRTIPSSVAAALSREIKEFVEEEAPLMVLMSSPGIKKVSGGGSLGMFLLRVGNNQPEGFGRRGGGGCRGTCYVSVASW